MRIKRMHKRMSIALLVFTITVMIVFNESARPVWLRSVSDSVSGILDPNQLYVRDDIDIDGNDVLVVVNIPRTGILRLTDHIVRHSVIQRPCSCKHYRTKCQCLNTNGYQWLFNAYNTTGFVCGEHASYNDIKYHCPMDYWMRTSGKDRRPFRRYHLLTMLREPVFRYISEWSELTTRDAYFLNEPRLWRKEPAELQKKGSSCWLGRRMAAVTLDDFVNCPDNPANNRMTKMLANVNYVDALKIQSEMKYKQALLFSAQNVLKRTAFFGLHHRLNDTQALLEEVLGAKLNKTLYFKTSEDTFKGLSPATKHKILMANDLDTKLYAFAKELFESRVAQWRQNHNKQSPIATKKDAAVTVAPEESKDEEEEEDKKAEEKAEDDEEEEEEEGEGEVVKAGDVIDKKKEDKEKEDKEKESGKDKEAEEEDEEDEDEKEEKTPTAKPSTVKPTVASSSSGTKPASSSTKDTASTSKTGTGGEKETKADDKEKPAVDKLSSGATTKATASPPGTKSSGTSGSNTGSVKATSDDVNDFFSKLAEAKETEKGQKAPTKESGASAPKSSSGGGSGSTQNPSLGEKFRQLQNHPTHKPDMGGEEEKKDKKELDVNEEKETKNNANVIETNKHSQALSPKDKTDISLAGKEKKTGIEKITDGQIQNETSGNVNGHAQNQNLNTSTDGSSTLGEFLDPFGLEANLTLGGDGGFVDEAAVNFTSVTNIDRLSTGVGQILTANEPEYRFDLAPGDAKQGQKSSTGLSSGSKVSSDSSMPGTKQKLEPGSSQSEPGKGFQVDEFNFGDGETLEEPKDLMTMGDPGESDLLSGKVGEGILGAPGSELTFDGKAMETVPDKAQNQPDGVTSGLDMNQLKTTDSDMTKDGLGIEQGVPSDSPSMAKGTTSSVDLGTTAGLEWGEQGIKESVSPMEPEIKIDETSLGGELDTTGLKSTQRVSFDGDLAGGLNVNKDGTQTSGPNLDPEAAAGTEQNMNSLKFGEETGLESQTMEALGMNQGVTNGDLKGTALEGLATEGLDASQFTNARNLDMDGPSFESPKLTLAPDARMQGRGSPPRGVFDAQRQQGMGDFRSGLVERPGEFDFETDQQLEAQDFESPTARFRIDRPLRRSPYRASRPDARSFDGYRGARFNRATLPARFSHRRRRRSSRRGGRLSEFTPLNEDEKQVRSMFV